MCLQIFMTFIIEFVFSQSIRALNFANSVWIGFSKKRRQLLSNSVKMKLNDYLGSISPTLWLKVQMRQKVFFSAVQFCQQNYAQL